MVVMLEMKSKLWNLLVNFKLGIESLKYQPILSISKLLKGANQQSRKTLKTRNRCKMRLTLRLRRSYKELKTKTPIEKTQEEVVSWVKSRELLDFETVFVKLLL
jgi:hypothetical protein